MYRFTRHYSLDEARALLPEVRRWLGRLELVSQQLLSADRTVEALVASGSDAGGSTVNLRLRLLAEMSALVQEFSRREIQLKDIDRGLVDFPSLRDGREVFLCWEQGEPDIEHWHDIDAGYAGRKDL